MTTGDRLLDLYDRRRRAQFPGSERAIARRELRGKLSARQRVELLTDPGSFFLLDEFSHGSLPRVDGGIGHGPPGDGVVAGVGRVHDRPVCVYAQDSTVLGGSLGHAQGHTILKVMEMAERLGCPLVAITDSAGARIQEGVDALAIYTQMGRAMIRNSGVIPQITLSLGSCAGGAAYGSGLSDFVVVVDGLSHMFVTGPEVVAHVLGHTPTLEDLGGAKMHAATTGIAHYLAADEADAVDWVRTLLGYLPASNREPAPEYARPGSPRFTDADLALDTLVPDSPTSSYDIMLAVRALLDEGEFLEVGELFGPALAVGFGRIDGSTVGLVSSRPRHLGGALDGDASDKAARFIRFCDAMHVAVVTLVDVPGFMPGVEEERAGILTRGAKLLYAYGEATVPLVTVVLRKAYGGGYGVLGSKHIGADINLAWPTAEIAVMGAEAAVHLLHGTEIAAAPDPLAAARLRSDLAATYRERLGTPYAAAARGYLDRVIAPHETRLAVSAALSMLRTKTVDRPTRKHGNIPL